MNLLIEVLASKNMRRLAVEDPSTWDDLVPASATHRVELVPIPVGPDGIATELLDQSGADAVLHVPAC